MENPQKRLRLFCCVLNHMNFGVPNHVITRINGVGNQFSHCTTKPSPTRLNGITNIIYLCWLHFGGPAGEILTSKTGYYQISRTTTPKSYENKVNPLHLLLRILKCKNWTLVQMVRVRDRISILRMSTYDLRLEISSQRAEE